MGNRILKQSICTSDTIDALGAEEERLFYRLIVNADDYGRLDGRLPIIRAACFPLRTEITLEALEGWLAQLEAVGLVYRYAVDGRPYFQLVSWNAHQTVRNKRSRFPAPEDGLSHPIESAPSRTQLHANEINCVSNPIQSESISESISESKKDPPPSADAAEAYSADFGTFWTVYPLKAEKRAAWKQWRTRIKAGVRPTELIAAATHYAAWCATVGQDPPFIKHAKTFLGPARPFEEWVNGIPSALQSRASPSAASPRPTIADQNQALLRRLMDDALAEEEVAHQ